MNEAGTFGFIVQGFAEKRYIRRDSASRLVYGTSSGWDVINTSTMKGIAAASLAGSGYKAADLNGVRLPGSMSTAFVEGVRDRKGGMFSLEFKPNRDLDDTVTGFTFAGATKATSDDYERRIASERHMRERQSAAYPGAITTAGDLQPYYDNEPFKNNTCYFTKTDRRFDNRLPSMNPRYELTREQIVRFGASRTVGRQNDNLLGAGFGNPTCDVQGCRVTGPNADIEPLTADNLDASWARYFARRSLVAVDLSYSRIQGYAKTGTKGGATIDLRDAAAQAMKTYVVQASEQRGAHIAGLGLSYEQPLGTTGFGFTSNVGRAGDDAGLQRQLEHHAQLAPHVRRDESDEREARLLPLPQGGTAEARCQRAPVLREPEVPVLTRTAPFFLHFRRCVGAVEGGL